MDSNQSDRQQPDDLRRQAEARVREIEEDTDEILSEIDARALVHELQVHQIELEMQNEELLRARAQAEDALERYTDLYDFAPIGYITLDHKWIIVESNLAAAELLGTTRRELVGTDFRLYVSRESLSAVQGCLQGMLEAEEKQSCELRLQRGARSGPYVRLVGSATPGSREKPRQCRVAIMDISERRLAESKLRRSYDEMEDRVVERTSEVNDARAESERRAAELQAVLASMAGGVILTDVEGGVTYVNDACIDMLEAPSGEAFEDWGNRFRRFTLDGEPIPVKDSPTQRALRGEIVRSASIIGVTPWGKELTISITASPIRDTSGRILGAIAIFHDISERVEFEKQRQELLEREHHIAEVLQHALVPPQRHYEVEGCRISVVYEAAAKEAEIGGDFYDVFDLGDGKIGITIGDVVGKGLYAAIRVAAARHSIRSYAFLDPSPARAMTLANEALSRDQSEDGAGMLTAIFAVLDTKDGTLTYASAGHEPSYIRDCEQGVTELDHIGRALGVLPGFAYTEAICTLRPGDMAVMVTDGITEAMNAQRAMFGREGVVHYLTHSAHASVEEVAWGILEAAKSYAGGRLRDDAAIVVFELA